MRATQEILDELVARLQAVTWTPAGGSAEPAFQVVKLYDLTDIEAAFQELLVTKQRVCLVIYAGTRYPDAGEGPGQVARRRVTEVTLLLSDRVHGGRQAAMFGGDNNPGAVKLLDRVIQELPGPLFDEVAGAVDCAPVNASVLDIEDLKKTHPGRVAAQLDLDCEDVAAPVIPPIEEREQVAAPVFDPVAGAFASAQSVTLTSATAGATIRYTTDGSQPTRSHGTIYAAPVAIAATTLLRAIAYKNGMVTSAETLGVFEILTETQVDYGASAPAITAVAGGSDYFDGGAYCLGFTFSVAAPITVTHLGVWDASPPKLTGSAPVCLMDNAGTVLASAVVGVGDRQESGELDGQFRYMRIPPITLEAGTYQIAGVVSISGFINATEFNLFGTPSFDPAITFGAGYTDISQVWVGESPFDEYNKVTLPAFENVATYGGQLNFVNFKFQ